MIGRVFIDTNILIYANDRSEGDKQRQAQLVLDEVVASDAGVLSTQVLGEFFNGVTQKIAAPLTLDEAGELVAEFVQAFRVVDLTPLVVLDAVRGVREHQLSYWDSLIWASARLNQIPVIFSEDFSSNIIFEGVRTVNPFAPDFQLADWV